MAEERKKAGVWPWIVALPIGLLIAYEASFGPAIWLMYRFGDPPWIQAYLSAFDPLEWVIVNLPSPANERLFSWFQDYYIWWHRISAPPP